MSRLDQSPEGSAEKPTKEVTTFDPKADVARIVGVPATNEFDPQVNQPVTEETAEAVEGLVDATASGAAAALGAAVAAGAQAAERAPEPELVAPGLGPTRPSHLEYSAPGESGDVVHGEMEVEDGGIVEVDPNASRAERRRAERANRKGRR